MEFCTTLDTIRDSLTKALQGYQFRLFCNIVLGIHKDSIPSYNVSGRELLEEQKVKLDKDKEESHKSAKLSGN